MDAVTGEAKLNAPPALRQLSVYMFTCNSPMSALLVFTLDNPGCLNLLKFPMKEVLPPYIEILDLV